MDNINVKVNLDLNDSKAKQKLESFKESASKQKIKVQLDFKNIENQTGKINKAFNNAFKLNSNNDLDKVERKLKEINNLLTRQRDINKNSRSNIGAKGLDSSIKEYLNVVKKIERLNAELHKAQSNNNTKAIQAINKEIQLYQRKQLSITSSIRANNLLSDSVKRIVIQEENLARARTRTRNAKTDDLGLKRQESELKRLNAEYDKYVNKLKSMKTQLNSMKQSKGFLDRNLVRKTNSLIDRSLYNVKTRGIESDFQRVSRTVKQLEANLKQINFGNTLSRQEANFNIALDNMRNRLERFKNSIQHIRGSERIIAPLVESFNRIKGDNIERASERLKLFGNNLHRVESEFKHLKTTSQGGFLANFAKDFKSNLLPFTAGQLLADGIRRAAYGVKHIIMEQDKAFTNLRKVANPEDIMNVRQLDEISYKATNIAKNVGQSSSDVVQSIADTIQMTGRSMKESTTIAEQTMKLANVADMTQEAATKGVATMVSAFNLNAFKQIPIVVNGTTKSVNEMENAFDKLNYVG